MKSFVIHWLQCFICWWDDLAHWTCI